MRHALLIVLASAALACRSPASPADQREDAGDDAPERVLPLGRFRADTAAYAVLSPLTEPQRRLITDEATWGAFWTQLHANQSPAPARPAVDFTGDIVIVAGLGTRPSGGYLVRVDSVYQRGSSFDVVISSHRPGPECIVPAVVTSPVDLVRVPRAAAHAMFRETALVRDCS